MGCAEMTRQEAIDAAVKSAWEEFGSYVCYQKDRAEKQLTSPEAVEYIRQMFGWMIHPDTQRMMFKKYGRRW